MKVLLLLGLVLIQDGEVFAKFLEQVLSRRKNTNYLESSIPLK